MSRMTGVAALIFAAFLYFRVASWLGLIVGIFGIAGAIAVQIVLMAQAKEICVPQCVCILEAAAFLGWEGTQQAFEIASPIYALAFMVDNEQKMVNVSPEARRLLEASGHGHRVNKPQAPRRYTS